MRVIAAIAVVLAACGQSEPEERVEAEPASAAPETSAPEIAAPSTAAPETAAPATASAAPETAASETAAPSTTATRVVKVTKVRRAPVIVYQASWCTPCHTLSAHLTRRGIRHLDKDIETTPGALDEMNAKTARAGRAGASLPVMDFRGRIVIGYDPAAVDRMCDEDLAAGAG